MKKNSYIFIVFTILLYQKTCIIAQENRKIFVTSYIGFSILDDSRWGETTYASPVGLKLLYRINKNIYIGGNCEINLIEYKYLIESRYYDVTLKEYWSMSQNIFGINLLYFFNLKKINPFLSLGSGLYTGKVYHSVSESDMTGKQDWEGNFDNVIGFNFGSGIKYQPHKTLFIFTEFICHIVSRKWGYKSKSYSMNNLAIHFGLGCSL